ncbi:hypothetical protein FOB82_05470 [Corynebacterium xerosis]|uniref:DUF3566 domain-containing protein n=1 Tax=Corynebacterium xerosis TaxID=1725 RepID=A0A6B8TC89_9CORY|nr:DUF3566 domain-containing protein [Corynebacterium xerosis]QGS34487.1 hypothetical protein FOB82_05470 [Corynebacterium xerosis]
MADTQLLVRRISPWTTLRVSAAIGVIGFLAWMVAVAVLYLLFEAMGFRDRFNDLLGDDAALGAGLIFAVAAGIGVLWALLITALATLGAVVYNACSELVGGITVTLDNVE